MGGGSTRFVIFSLARPLPISICAMVMRNGPTGNNESPYVSILCIFI